MEVKIKRSKRRTVSIKILNSGIVQVNCPLRYTDNQIQKILYDKNDWIHKSLSKVQKTHNDNKLFYEYKKILFLGQEYQLEIMDNTIQIGDNKVKYRKGSSVQNTIKKWLTEMAESLILQRLSQLSQYCKLSYKSSKIISARKKWGSCSSSKEIRLNFRMIMLSNRCIDYICIHELCHLKYMNHSTKFWNLVKDYISDYKQIKKEISNKNFVLELF